MGFDFLYGFLRLKKLAKPQNPAGLPTYLWLGVYQTDFCYPLGKTWYFFENLPILKDLEKRSRSCEVYF